MSAVWLKMSVLCLCYAELTRAGVMWRKAGEFITIQCRPDSKQELLSLKRGLFEEEQIFYQTQFTLKGTVNETMTERVQTHVDFPKVDIVIKNLTVTDTGPYWCLYGTIDDHSQLTKSSGSVLLVVTDSRPAGAAKDDLVCESSRMNVVILSAAVFAGILFTVMLLLIIRLNCKKKTSSSSSVKPGRLTNNNDVYEDMRGTIRR